MPLVDRRYAEALIDIASERGHEGIEIFKKDFKLLMDSLNTSPELGELIKNQTIKRSTKKDILQKIFSGKIDKDLLNFLLLLIDKSRESILSGVFREFILLCEKRYSVLVVKIFTAFELDQHQINEIEEKFRKMYGKLLVKSEVILDSSLIGGIKIRVGDQEFDSTVKGRLEQMLETVVKG